MRYTDSTCPAEACCEGRTSKLTANRGVHVSESGHRTRGCEQLRYRKSW